jgi:hypothetical protein
MRAQGTSDRHDEVPALHHGLRDGKLFLKARRCAEADQSVGLGWVHREFFASPVTMTEFSACA